MAEFIDFMKRAKQAVEARLQDPAVRELWEKAVGKLGQPGCGPIYSFDHPNIHGGKKPQAVMRALGLTLADHFMLPTHSCDIHRVIEHTHARLVRTFQTWLYEDSAQYNLATYKAVLETLFYHGAGVAEPHVIAKDVKGLPELFQELINIRGAWPAKHFR